MLHIVFCCTTLSHVATQGHCFKKTTILQSFITFWQSLLHCFFGWQTVKDYTQIVYSPTFGHNVFCPLGCSGGAMLFFQSSNNSRPEHLKASWHRDPGVFRRFFPKGWPVHWFTETVQSDVATRGMSAKSVVCTLIMEKDCANPPDWLDIIQK